MGYPEELPPAPADAEEEAHPAFALLFRSWVTLVLLILCISLLQYLLMKLSR